MLRVNIAKVILLRNVVLWRIQTTLARRYSYAMLGASRTILHRAFYLCNDCPKSIKTTVNRIFPDAMLSGVSKTTLHKVFRVQRCPKRYSWDNIAQIKILCSIVKEAPNIIAQVKTLYNVVLEAPENSALEKVLFNAVFIHFVQLGTGQNPMQCFPRGLRQHCISKNPVQYCLNNIGTTLFRSKSYATFSESL